MADNVSYSVTQVPQLSPPQQQQKRRSSESEVGGKKKAKTKHLSQKGQSKTAEREALRRHLALERQISRAQRTNANGTNSVSPVPAVAPSTDPTAEEVLKTWSPPGETEQLDSSNPSSPASSPDRTPAPHSNDKAQEGIWSAQFHAFMQDAFSQFMASKGQVAFHTPRKGRARPPPTSTSETSSQLGEGDSVDLDMSDMPLSEDEETAPEQATSSGLFNPALLKSLLVKAVSTVNLTSVQDEKPSTSKEANPLFAKKVPQDKYIPCAEVFMTTLEEQWSSLASPPAPNSAERKLFNLSPSFSNMLEVPTVDNPLISLFSTSAIPGDMAEVLRPEEKKFEHSLRRSHMAAAWAARAATSSSFFARASIMWLRELQGTVPPDQDTAEDIHAIDSCEYIWEAGVGFAHSPSPNFSHDLNRTELLKLLLTCFSEVMYLPPSSDSSNTNPWVQFFCSIENRHALPLFTSLLNIVCAYDPVGYGIPYNHLLFSDYREPLVEQAAQVLIVTLDYDTSTSSSPTVDGTTTGTVMDDTDPPGPDNLFVNYLSRIHREEDFQFVLKGVARLLSNPLLQTYLPNSTKKIQFHQELLVLFWKLCDFNKKFLFFVLKSSDVLDILVPILYFLNDARADQSRVGLMHIGVFILLLLSGERNFGVRLNKPYSVRVPMDIPVFTGTHADLLIIAFHKIITSGHQRLQPLFDCLLTIIVNVSPYLKSLSMVAANKLLHLLEAFSTTWFLFSMVQNHHLVFFLLEVFNNIIQYQFDGNSNLVYAIIRKRNVFHQLANLPTDLQAIQKALQRKKKAPEPISRTNSQEGMSMEGSRPAAPAEPGTLKTSLVATPGIDKLTEKSQVSEDGTMRSLEPESSQSPVEESPPGMASDTETWNPESSQSRRDRRRLSSTSSVGQWNPTPEWVVSWKSKLPLQTIMRLLQVLVPQVEKICIDKGLTDESEILKFLQHGTLVGLLPVPHPILIRKYQANSGTAMWFRTYMWGVIYLRNVDPPIWYDTDVKLFEIQRV